MDALIRWSLGNRVLVVLLAAGLAVWGGLAAADSPVDVFPDLTAPTVTVLTETAGMASTEVERLVTFPIEVALNGAPGLRRLRSASTAGISVVYADFEWGAEVYRARQIVTERLAQVSSLLPEEASEPVLAPISSIMGEILFLGLTGAGDEMARRTFADTVLRRRLLALPGVAQVAPLGGGVRQYQVWLEPARLQAHGLSVQAVAAALRAANRNVAAGFLEESGSEYLLRGIGRFRDPAGLEAAVVAARDGVPVQLHDLGRVEIGPRQARGTGSVMGEPGVVIAVQRQPGVNTLELTARIDAVLDEVEATLPPDWTLHRDLVRQADFIEGAVANLLHALRDGAILVVFVVGFFLINLRATVITLTALPLSLLAAVLLLSWLGHSLNAMTLGGLAIAVGALVDDAVIDVENVVRRLRENAGRPEAARRQSWQVVLEASVEIRKSIVFATLIITLVFVPLFFLAGVEGRLLLPLGLAYILALGASLFVAVTLTPVLCSLLLPGTRSVRAGSEAGHIRLLKSAYAVLLRPVLRAPLPVLAAAVLLLVLAAVEARRFGSAFLPEFQEGALTISAVTLPGVSLPESDRLGRMAEQIILARPEVASVARRTGRAERNEHAEGVEFSEIDVRLRAELDDREAFLAGLRADLGLVPGMHFTLGGPISHRIDHMLSGTRAALAVKIFGPELQELAGLAQSVEAAMADIPGIVDLQVEPQSAVPALRVVFDPVAMGRQGVAAGEAAASLEALRQGHLAGEILEGSYRFDLVLRLGMPSGGLPALADVPVVAGGALVPLGAFAELRRDAVPNKVLRENGQRRLVVSCNVAGRDLGSVVADTRAAVLPLLQDRAGYRVEFGGQFESAEAARKRLLILGAAVVAGVLLLLNRAFRSMRDALLVMANLPLALIGGVAGVHLGGHVVSVGSIIGFIAVFGIATRNGIMLVSHIRHLLEEEGVVDLREAVRRGAEERLVPILMTAVGTAIALLPLALAGGASGSEIQTPMAQVILCGLASSTILNMIVVPALYLRFGRAGSTAAASA